MKDECKIQLFPAAGPSDIMAIDILGPLPKTSSGYQQVVTTTDRYLKLTRAIITSENHNDASSDYITRKLDTTLQHPKLLIDR